jgi:hypothetical protein
MEPHVHLIYACPVGTAVCDDVRADNGLLLLLPLAVVVAFLVAWPLSRFLPPRPLLGWSLAIIGAVLYVYLWTGLGAGPLLGFLISVIGIGLARGKATTEPRSA